MQVVGIILCILEICDYEHFQLCFPVALSNLLKAKLRYMQVSIFLHKKLVARTYKFPGNSVYQNIMFAVKLYVNSWLSFRFFFNIIVWDLLAKYKTSEAQTSCEKLRCFLPVNTQSWDHRVETCSVPVSVQAPGSVLRGNAAYTFRIPGRNAAQPPSTWMPCLGKVKAQEYLFHSFMDSTNIHFDARLLEMSVELQLHAPLCHKPTTPHCYPSPPC